MMDNLILGFATTTLMQSLASKKDIMGHVLFQLRHEWYCHTWTCVLYSLSCYMQLSACGCVLGTRILTGPCVESNTSSKHSTFMFVVWYYHKHGILRVPSCSVLLCRDLIGRIKAVIWLMVIHKQILVIGRWVNSFFSFFFFLLFSRSLIEAIKGLQYSSELVNLSWAAKSSMLMLFGEMEHLGTPILKWLGQPLLEC